MKWWLILVAFLLVTPAFADQLTITLNEKGKVTSYLNTYWVVNVNGTGTLINPSERDLFDVRLYFDVLGLDVIDRGGQGRFEGDSLLFDHLPPGAEADFSYQIVGIAPEPPTLAGKGVFYTGLAKRTPRIYSDVFGELQKAPLEERSVTGRDARLISMSLTNPTSFRFTIEEVRVLKSSSRNPNARLDDWEIVSADAPRSLDPDGIFVHDFVDRDAHEGEVYWLQTEVYISSFDLVDKSNLSRFTEENLTIPAELLNYTNETDNTSMDAISAVYLLRKQLGDRIAIPGEPLAISLILHNFGDTIADYSLTDTLPPGFEASEELSWTGSVPARGTAVVSYQAILNDTRTPGIDTFPSAVAEVGGVSVRSPEVSYVRQYVPDDRVYVQKRVQYRDDDQVTVSLSVQNLGRSTVHEATLKEFLEDSDLFSEITQSPEGKGVWRLPAIAPGETWEVSYVTEPTHSLTTLPAVYGLPSQNVLRSIVLENVVSEAWEFVRTNFVELVGVLVVIGVPVLFFAGRRYGWIS